MREHGKSRRLVSAPRLVDEHVGPLAGAACVGLDSEAFFPGRAQLSDDNLAALEVCARCPVRVECATIAIRDNLEGIWGGTTESNRNRRVRQGKLRATWTAADTVELLENLPPHKRRYSPDELVEMGREIRRQLAAGKSRARITEQLGVPDSVYRRAVAAVDEYDIAQAATAKARMDEHWVTT